MVRSKIEDGINIASVRKSIVRVIGRIAKKFGPEYGQMVLCYDDKNYWRREIFPSTRRTGARNGKHQYNWDEVFSVLNTIRDEIKGNLLITSSRSRVQKPMTSSVPSVSTMLRRITQRRLLSSPPTRISFSFTDLTSCVSTTLFVIDGLRTITPSSIFRNTSSVATARMVSPHPYL